MASDDKNQELNVNLEKKPICGIVMPISSIDNCSESHWVDVKGIITCAIEKSGFEAQLVSEANDSGIIQKRIVQNLYSNDIVICDVSCKNPNVMFELGMRLAFDKPTIVIMDNMTQYSFDTAPIEHLGYPRDLNYYQILKFQDELSKKIKGTVEAAKQPQYTTFLKNFGEFHVAEIENKEGSMDQVVLSKLEELSNQIAGIKYNQRVRPFTRSESEIETEDINNLTRKLIRLFCEEKKIEESELYSADESDEMRILLYNYMTNSRSMRRMCGSPDGIRKAISENLLPF